jgi:hypothetical protein
MAHKNPENVLSCLDSATDSIAWSESPQLPKHQLSLVNSGVAMVYIMLSSQSCCEHQMRTNGQCIRRPFAVHNVHSKCKIWSSHFWLNMATSTWAHLQGHSVKNMKHHPPNTQHFSDSLQTLQWSLASISKQEKERWSLNSGRRQRRLFFVMYRTPQAQIPFKDLPLYLL